jgi:hypothetical protein
MFKRLRIGIFNWFAAGKMTLTYEKPSEYISFNNVSSGSGQLYYNINPQSQVPEMNLAKSNINFNVAKATGGWIVQVNLPQQNVLNIVGSPPSNAELYLIHDSEDFDSALGKIVTTACLKA